MLLAKVIVVAVTLRTSKNSWFPTSTVSPATPCKLMRSTSSPAAMPLLSVSETETRSTEVPVAVAASMR